ncbi:MAG: CcmD family protein [Cytophagales bacterium]|nr:CcmD family protein [Cytophagales bacterium]
MKFLNTLLILLVSRFTGMAQQADIEMADQFRADGKIYVVIAVVLLILVGIFIYLFNLDKKVTRLEKEVSKNA